MISIATVLRTNNHLKSSRWSKNDISFTFFFAIIGFLLLVYRVGVKRLYILRCQLQ